MADSRLNVTIDGRDNLTPQLRSLESGVIRFVGAVSASLAAIRIGAAPIVAAAQFERELANVAKTTGFVSKEISGGVGDLDRLAEALQEVSLRVGTTAVDLAKIAASAGQQGLGRYGVEGVVAFTDSVARMANVLDLTAEDSAKAIGKIINIFRIPILDVERTVSTINEITNQTTADGEDLIDTIKRIGDAAGALNLQQAAALGAAALDFGLTPEVVGTSFNKIFSSFLEDAQRYAGVVKGIVTETGTELDGSADQWIKTVQKNGLEAFRAYLAGLRKLDAQSQQAAILKLTGGGRIGALMNKFIQDTTDAVLLRAVGAANEGNAGFSAIEEQARVTQTLTEQSKILLNSINKLGEDAASGLLPKLTAITAQLSEALQTPAFKQFVDAAVEALGDLIFGFVDLVKYISSLNINWENFIQLLKVFLTLKAAQYVGALAASFSFFGVSLKSISGSAAKAAADLNKVEKGAESAGATMEAAGQKGFKAWFAQASGMDVWLEKDRRVRAALQEQKKANEELRVAEKARADLATQSIVQATGTGKDTAAARKASQATSSERGNLTAANQRAAAAAQAVQAQQAARLERAERESAARRLAIETDYQTRRKAITATGTETGLKALRAEKAAMLAEEQAHYERSLRSINGHYAGRLRAQQAANAQEIAAARSALAAKLVAERDALRKAGGATAAQAGTTAALAAADAAVNAARSRVTMLASVAAAAQASISTIGATVRGLAGMLALAGRVIAGGFFWITLLYTIIDLTVGFDKLGKAATWITDKLGLSSAEARDAAAAQRELAEASRKAAAEYDDLVEAYKQRINPATGQLDQKKLDADAATLKNSDSTDKQQQALLALAETARAVREEIRKYSEMSAKDSNAAAQAVQADIDRLGALYAKAKAEREKSLAPLVIAQKDRELDALQKQIDALTEKYREYQKAGVDASKEVARATKDLATVGGTLASAFSPKAFEGMKDLALPLADAADLAKKTKDAYLEASNAGAKAADTGGAKNLTVLKDEANKADLALRAAIEKLRVFVVEQSNSKGLSEQAKSSLLLLLEVGKLNPELIRAIFSAVATQPQAAFTSKNAPPVAPNPNGNNPFKGGSGAGEESEARKLARAQLQLAKTRLEAQNALAEEMDDQKLDAEKRAFDEGLTNIKDYYNRRDSIQREALTRELELKEKELKLIEFEEKKKMKESERVKLQADKARIEGEMAVLAARRAVNSDTNDAEAKKDQREFNLRALSESNRLASDSVIDSTFDSRFTANLQALTLEHQQWLASLRSSNIAGMKALADSFETGLSVTAFREALEPMAQQIEIVFTDLERTQSRLDVLSRAGALNVIEANNAANLAVKARIPLIEREISLMEEAIRVAMARPGVTAAALSKEIAQLDQLKDKLFELKNQQDALAVSLNRSFVDTVSSGFKDMVDKTKRASEAINDIVNGVKKTITDALVDDFTDTIAGSLGMNGGGGLGGFIVQALTGKPAKGKELGQSATNPMHVKVVSGLPTDDPVGTAKELIEDPEGAFTKLKEGFSSLFDSLQTGLGDTVDAISGFLSSMFNGSGGGSGNGGWISFLGSLFHSGGIVGGKGAKRLMTYDMLRNAERYHSGTARAGLASNEVPAILEKGEAVLTERQQATIGAALDSRSKRERPAPAPVLQIHPEMMNYTLRDWFERELARTYAHR